MANKTKRKNVKTTKKVFASPFNNYWNKTNYMILILGMIIIVAGFYLLGVGNWDSTASLVFAPILLFIGFVVLIPASIFYVKKSEKNPEIKT
jgi:uncharacterized membrane protein